MMLRPAVNCAGFACLNELVYASSLRKRGRAQIQSRAQWAFTADYRAATRGLFRPGGFIEYQVFIPEAHAARVFWTLLRAAHARGLPAHLCTIKRHRRDGYLLSYGVDGYSLSLDFHVTRGNHEQLRRMISGFDRHVLEAGGKFYLAKDSTLSRSTLAASLTEERIARFLEIKKRYDAMDLFQSDLYRRLLAPMPAGHELQGGRV